MDEPTDADLRPRHKPAEPPNPLLHVPTDADLSVMIERAMNGLQAQEDCQLVEAAVSYNAIVRHQGSEDLMDCLILLGAATCLSKRRQMICNAMNKLMLINHDEILDVSSGGREAADSEADESLLDAIFELGLVTYQKLRPQAGMKGQTDAQE